MKKTFAISALLCITAKPQVQSGTFLIRKPRLLFINVNNITGGDMP